MTASHSPSDPLSFDPSHPSLRTGDDGQPLPLRHRARSLWVSLKTPSVDDLLGAAKVCLINVV
ncbi:hypothetical protein ACE6H2_007190 [Prunus campanulata]